MAKEMLINVSEGEECRIAIVEDGRLEELYMERASSTSHVGNIYKGRVTNVEPSIQAAFVDFGLGRNGFLHISDLMPTYFGRKGEDFQESVGRKMARRDRPPIQRCLRRGDEITVQIIKEGIGTKGPTLSTYLSIPGRILVMMPGMSKFGISRKIEDELERKRLRGILDSLKPIDDVGFIIRTAGVGKTKTEIQRDLTYLTRLWTTIQKKLKLPAPQELYTEGDLVTRTVRDVFSSDISRIVVDNEGVTKTIREFFKIAMPRTKNKVELYDEPMPLFHKYGMEREIELMYSRHVPLPSGGSLVIDSTEAIVAIDVNSGKFREHADAETTAFKTDMEAADEIPRQLRLRDLGGVIICDFIDLRYERHRRELEKTLHDNLKKDRAKTKVLRMSQFGIIEMTRQRMRPSLKRSIYFDCPHCKGSGLVKTPESMSLDVMRRLTIAAHDQRVSRVELAACPEVAFYVLNKKRGQLAELEGETKKRIVVRQDSALGLDEMRLELFDQRDGMIYLDSLGMSPHESGDERGRRHQQPTPAGRRDQQRRPQIAGHHGAHRGPAQPLPPPRPIPSRAESEFEDEPFEREEPEEQELEVSAPAPARKPMPAPAAKARVSAPVSSNVEDVEEAAEPMGEAPRGMDEDRYDSSNNGGGGSGGGGDDAGRGRRRRRGRRGRGGKSRGDARGPGAAPPPPADHVSSVSHRAVVSDHGDNGVVENEDVEATFQPDEDAPVPSGSARAVAGKNPVNSALTDVGGEGAAEEGQPKRRRRRRGGRRHRRRKAGDAPPSADAPAEPVEMPEGASVSEADLEPARHTTAPQRVPPAQQPQSPRRGGGHAPAVHQPPVVKTGSTDRHLIQDEPVIHEPPPRRPRTYRDLDAIPEDFD